MSRLVRHYTHELDDMTHLPRSLRSLRHAAVYSMSSAVVRCGPSYGRSGQYLASHSQLVDTVDNFHYRVRPREALGD